MTDKDQTNTPNDKPSTITDLRIRALIVTKSTLDL